MIERRSSAAGGSQRGMERLKFILGNGNDRPIAQRATICRAMRAHGREKVFVILPAGFPARFDSSIDINRCELPQANSCRSSTNRCQAFRFTLLARQPNTDTLERSL